jgi:hypothetical protein
LPSKNNGRFQQVLSNTETEAEIREEENGSAASSAALESVVGVEALPVTTSDNPTSEQAATLQRGLGEGVAFPPPELGPIVVSDFLARNIRRRMQ